VEESGGLIRAAVQIVARDAVGRWAGDAQTRLHTGKQANLMWPEHRRSRRIRAERKETRRRRKYMTAGTTSTTATRERFDIITMRHSLCLGRQNGKTRDSLAERTRLEQQVQPPLDSDAAHYFPPTRWLCSTSLVSWVGRLVSCVGWLVSCVGRLVTCVGRLVSCVGRLVSCVWKNDLHFTTPPGMACGTGKSARRLGESFEFAARQVMCLLIHVCR